MRLALLLALLFSAPAFVYAIGQWRPRVSGYAAAGVSAVAFAAVWAIWIGGGSAFTSSWAPSWNLELAFGLDGLAAAYALIAAGIACVVAVYSLQYMPAHLRHAGRPARDLARFHALLLLFMASMIGLVTTRELYSLIVFWDLTAVVSFLLIGTDRDDADAQRSAVMALVVTAGSAVPLVVAAVLLHAHAGSSLIDDVHTGAAIPPAILTASVVCILVAAMAKSAQAPLHFWLPRAMVAPTPISAYLHSAAMVAAGVFLISRLHPLLALSDITGPALITIGGTSILTGSAMALAARDVKRVLACSTIAQYGYVMLLLGWGGEHGLGGATFYVIVHAIAKSALFLTAGIAVDAFGGRHDLGEMHGLARRMPVVAAASAVAAATLSGLPLTPGFFKDELFFAAAREHGAAASACAIVAVGLTLAYTWRWWMAIFAGAPRRLSRQPAPLLSWCVAALALVALAGGLNAAPAASLASAAASVMAGADLHAEARYHFAWRPEYGMALAAFTLGATLLLGARLAPADRWLRRGALLTRVGPDRLYTTAMAGLTALSSRLHDLEVRDLRMRAAAVLVPGGCLIFAALASSPLEHGFRVGALGADDVPLVAALGAAGVAAVAATRPLRHPPLIVLLSTASFSMAIVFAMFGAPDVALVAVLVQTVQTLLLVGILSLFHPRASRGASRAAAARPKRYSAVGWLSGAASFGLTWAIVSWQASAETPGRYVDLAPAAHADNVVTAVLTDFRGLDTMGEATVMAVALLGAAALLGKGRHR